MTTEEAGLLAAIHENPDDDTARLVYADWLEESGRVTHADAIRRGVTKKVKRWTFAVGKPAVVSYTSERPESRGEAVSVELAPGVPGAQWVAYKGTVEVLLCPWAWWLGACDTHGGTEPLWATRVAPEVWLTTRPSLACYDEDCADDGGTLYRLYLLPGHRVPFRVNDGEDPIEVCLREYFPWVKRWNYPKFIRAWRPSHMGPGPTFTLTQDQRPEVGDRVELFDGSTGVLEPPVDDDGYALVRRTDK